MENAVQNHARHHQVAGEETLLPADATQTLEWITVLSAARLDYRLSHETDRWLIHVPDAHAEAASAELRAYEHERASGTLRFPAARTGGRERYAVWTAFWCAHALVLLYLWLGPYDAAVPLLAAAGADAERILAGEWWRTATALTLHAGWPHLLGNVLFLVCVGQAVFRALGRGLGLTLLVAGGMIGNWLAAMTAAGPRVAVGASTLCFAALGVMSVLQSAELYRREREWRALWKRAWIPMAAGVALLGMIGAGPQSDLAAHAFGFAAGTVVGAPFALRPALRPSESGQWILAATAALVPAFAWSMAWMQTG